MRARRVVWSRDALDELIDIATYIARDNPAAARRVAERLRQEGRSLGNAPLGRPGRIPGTYEKVVRRLPYIIAYVLGESPDGSEEVVILRVIHGARDWPNGRWPEE